MGPPSVRPWRTPAVISALSRSIFIRPPRPWPSWRRAMSSLTASRSSSSPAGRPSTIVVRPGPWLSPAVMTRSDTRGSLLRLPAWSPTLRLPQPGGQVRDGRAQGVPAALEGAARGVEAIPGRSVVRGARTDDARAGARARAGLGGRGGPALVDLEQVELVLLGDGAGLVLDVEELGLAGPQADRLAVVGPGHALAVADGLDAVVDEEDRGLAVLQHAHVDEHGLGRRGQRLEALERPARQVVAGAEANGQLVHGVGLGLRSGRRVDRGRSRGGRRRRAGGRRGAAATAAGRAGLGAVAAARGPHDAGRRLVGRLGRIVRLRHRERVLALADHDAAPTGVGRRRDDRLLGELVVAGLGRGRRRGRHGLGILGQHHGHHRQSGEEQDRDGPQAPLDQLTPEVLDRAHRTPVIVAEVVGGVEPPEPSDGWGVVPAGAVGDAPAVRPCVEGRRYEAAPICASSLPRSPSSGVIAMLPSRSRRPVTSMSSFCTVTKCSSRWKKSDSVKKLPLKANVKGIAEKPALPTGTAPGAGASAPVSPVVVLLPSVEAPPVPTLSDRKLTFDRFAVASSWTSSERTSSSAGTALPSRAIVV